MKAEEITEGNKLISEFMGWEKSIYENLPNKVYKDNYTIGMHLDQLNYHSSWDSIMPVVEKIEAIGYGFHKDPFDLNIIEYLSGNENQIIAYQNNIDEKLIQKWYYVVVEFIKWYNNQKDKCFTCGSSDLITNPSGEVVACNNCKDC